MKLHVFIDPVTDYPTRLIEAEDDAPIPDGAVAMTVSEYNAYLSTKTPPPPDLSLTQAEACQEVNAFRDAQEATVFPYLGTQFDADSRSVLRILAVVSAAQLAVANGLDFSIDWTDASNNTVSLSASDIIGMPEAMVTYANGLHASAREAKELINAATSAAEIENIVSNYKVGL